MTLTLPTIITIGRILLSLPLGYFILNEEFYLALLVYIIAASSDYLDGLLARRLNQETTFGAMLDQLADKTLVITTLFMLAVIGHLSSSLAFASLLIILREFLILGFREFIAITQKKTVKVSKTAKWKTALTLIALAFLLYHNYSPNAYAAAFGEALLWLSVLMSIASAVGYWRSITKAPQRS